MIVELRWIASMALSLLCGVLGAWMVMRRHVARAFDAGRASRGSDLERISGALDQAQAVREDLATRLAVAEQKNSEIPEFKSAIAEQRQRLLALHAALAAEKTRASQCQSLAERLETREQTIQDLQARLAEKDAQIAELGARLIGERRQAEEKLALLQDARQALADQFRVLAQEILDEKGRALQEQSQSGLRGLLDPFREQLHEFRRKVDDVYVQEARERATLKKEIETLRDLNRQMGREAVNLTRALKGDKKAQGIWGELVLSRVLEKSGLRNGVEYQAQGAFRDGEGNLLRPDVVVHLPEDRCVVVDSKLSLVAYARYANAESETERRQALAEHVGAVRAHIEALSAKAYTDLKGVRTLDYILMFMPIDAAFVAAFGADETLYSDAFERRIVVVTPSTLLATLKTIENIWRYERQNRSAQEVFARAAAIYDKLRRFVESMEKIGLQLGAVQGTWDLAMNRLVRGKGNVISQVARFSDLGVPVKQPLPASVLERAKIDDRLS